MHFLKSGRRHSFQLSSFKFSVETFGSLWVVSITRHPQYENFRQHKRFLFVFLPIQLLLFHRYNIWYLMCICVTPYHTKLYQTPVAVLYDMFMSWLMFWKDQYRETEENQWKKLLGWAISCRCVNQSPSCFREGSTKNEGYKWHEKKYNVLIQFMHVWYFLVLIDYE